MIIISAEIRKDMKQISEELYSKQCNSDVYIANIKQNIIGKYFKLLFGGITYIGYVKDIIEGFGEYDLEINFCEVTFDKCDGVSLEVKPSSFILCNIDEVTNIQYITKEEVKKIFKEYIDNINKYFEDKVIY